MAEEIGGLRIKLDIEGSNLQQGLQQINREMKVLESNFKAQGAGIADFGSSLEGLKAKASMLTGQVDLQKQKIEALNNAYQKSVQETGEYSKNSQNLQIQINNASASLKKMEVDLLSTNEKISKQSSEWTKLGNSLKSVSSQMKTVGEGFSNVGSNLTTKVSLPLAGVGAVGFKMASDMIETLNKVDTVFDENANTVEKWSETALEKMGMAQETALDMASSFGDMGAGMGLSSQDNLKYSESLTQLASDMASFKNIKVDVAKTALTSIYTGETESLKQLGIVMTQANLQEYAHSQGINKKIQQMTQAEQVQLRYNYVMEKTKNSQGDFEKTNQSSSNQLKIFSESMKELGTNIGEKLIPVLTPLIINLNNIVKNFSKMNDGTKKTIVTLGMIVAGIGPVILIIGKLITFCSSVAAAFSTISTAIGGASGALAALSGPIGWVIAAVVALIGVGIALYKNWDQVKAYCIDLGKSISETWNTIVNSVRTFVSSLVQFVTDKFGSQIQSIKSIFDSMKQIFISYWDIIKNIFLGAILIVIDLFKGDFGSLKEHASQIMTNIKTSISNIWDNIKNIFAQYIKIIITTFSQLKSGVGTVINNVRTAIETGLNKAMDFIRGLPAQTLQFGKDIVQGLINGIQSMISKVKEVASQLADGIKEKIKGALGIHSPSRVMMEIGGYTTEGLALGMENGQYLVTDTVKGITNNMIRGFSGTKLGSVNNNSSSITVVNQGTIVGSNGMNEFADIVSRKISNKFGLSVGGAF